MPKNSPHANDTASENQSTVESTAISPRRGSGYPTGRMRITAGTHQQASANPSNPAATASSRLSTAV